MEKIIEKEIVKEVPVQLPKGVKGILNQALKHAKRTGKKVPDNINRFFKD